MLYAVMKKSYSIDSEISTVLRASAILMHILAVARPSITRCYYVEMAEPGIAEFSSYDRAFCDIITLQPHESLRGIKISGN